MSRLRTATFLVGAGALAAAGVWAPDASACGACFGPRSESTVVSGHRMVLSIAASQTTLYDQITYQGNPSSFAWVLPIHGQVTVGISADIMFQTLDTNTAHTVSPPPYSCPGPPPGCALPPTAFGVGGAAEDGGVSVLSQQTVGPYETVQLSSQDPMALESWLASHGYALPDDMQPIIAAYVQEGMDFLALKLVPGAGVAAMRPVRVTMPGAAPVLPLRMVAGGTGATVPITLWVIAEAAYEPEAPFSAFRIAAADLVWDFASSSSNYGALREAQYQATQGYGWLTEVSVPFSAMGFKTQIQNAVQYGQGNDYAPTGGPDAGGVPPSDMAAALMAASDDMAALFGGMNPTNVRVTRLHGELPRATLATDLSVGAAADTSDVPLSEQATGSTGMPPCPSYQYCTNAGGSGGTGGGTSGSGGGPFGPGGPFGSGGATGVAGSAGAAMSSSSDGGTALAASGGSDSSGCAVASLSLGRAPLGPRGVWAGLSLLGLGLVGLLKRKRQA